MNQPQWLADWLFSPATKYERELEARLAARRLLRPLHRQAALRGVQTRKAERQIHGGAK
jgi:hypothetical protein